MKTKHLIIAAFSALLAAGCNNGNVLPEGWSEVEGNIVSDRQYSDFVLSWEWQGAGEVLYHVSDDPYFETPEATGQQYPFSCDGTGWNKSKIVFEGGHVEHWLNGNMILEFDCWTDDWFAMKSNLAGSTEYGLAHKGLIVFQRVGDGPVSVRKLKIKELPHKGGREEVLFNGKDLTGWEPFGDLNCYVDEEGNLVTENGNERKYGYLCTRKYYKDFDLSCEFKEESNGNSGLFFHSYIQGFNKVCGWQCEVAPKGCDTGGIYESYGRGWLVQIPDEKEEILHEDGWNKLRLRVEGGHVQTWLNGEAMVDIEDELIGSKDGRIMLQMHDGNDIKVLWRNFNIVEL